MLRSYLCDYSDAYIVFKGRLSVTGANNASFRSCIAKINNTLIDNAEHVDIVIPMCNLLKYGYNYSMTSGNLWNYYRII